MMTDMQTTTVEALTPFVVLNQTTPISWTDDYGVHQLPMTYVKGGMGNVNLQFSTTDPLDTPHPYRLHVRQFHGTIRLCR